MKNRLGITEGNYEIIEHSWSDTSFVAGDKTIATVSIYDEATEDNQEELELEVVNNFNLIKDAFENTRKTGLLPSELLEQRNKLIAEVKELRKEFRRVAPAELFSNLHPYKTSEKLIKSIESDGK